MLYAIIAFTFVSQVAGLSGHPTLSPYIPCSLYCFTEHALLSMLFKALYYPGFALHRLSFRLLALTVFVAWFGHPSLPCHVIVMLTHVQTLLNQSYKITRTMIQYVLRIVLRKCLFYAPSMLIRVSGFDRWSRIHTLYISITGVSVCKRLS